MSIFEYSDADKVGIVDVVDTATVIVRVDNPDKLKNVQVNHLIVLRSSRVGQHLIAFVSKIMRKAIIENNGDEASSENFAVENLIHATLIGTHIDKWGTKENIFKRTLETVPEINADCFLLQGERLTQFMNAISKLSSSTDVPLSIGNYTLNDDAQAFLDGNKFFQRHAVIVGSTGSGKSWTVAKILEQVGKLPSANAIVFDIHGEYSPFNGPGFQHLKIAGPNDSPSDDILFLPYWLLSYDEMIALLLDRSDSNAPNQAMAFSREVLKSKSQKNRDNGLDFTIDSPIPYDLDEVIQNLEELDTEMIPSSSTREKQGPFHGKLTRFIQRLKAKKSDKRLNFLFNADSSLMEYEWLESFATDLLHCTYNDINGVKIIDFSEVPSDILPLIISLVARFVFSLQMWTPKDKRHPIALFCDEAHLYIAERTTTSVDVAAVNSFERISKEGRKYGVGLVVISQRPSEVNRTVLSQSNNYIAMRLTNAEDQSVIKRLLPDSLGGFSDLLPILDVGEAIVVGDASLLPSRIRVLEPEIKPLSATIPFWDKWAENKVENGILEAVDGLRKQSK